MSWTVHISEVPAKKAIGALKKLFSETYTAPSLEVTEQFEAAIAGLKGSLKAITPASGDVLVAISANGHANPDHKKVPDWGGDFIASSVSYVGEVKSDAPAAAAEAEAETEAPAASKK